MKKVTKVILAAALVLLVFGAFTGAAAALDVTKLTPLTTETGTSVTYGVTAGAIEAPLYQARQLPSDSAPIAAVIVKVVEKKGDSSVTPLIPSFPPCIPVKPETVKQTTVKHTYVSGMLAAQGALAIQAAQATLEIAR